MKPKPIRLFSRVAMMLFMMMLTTMTAWATDKTLSGSENYTAQDGDVLTGSTSGTVTIASDASITISDVTITGGIVCEGSATITLVGTNSVNVNNVSSSLVFQTAGIQIGGGGTVYAEGEERGTGIGGGSKADGATVVINGGTVTAKAGIQYYSSGTSGAIGSENGDGHRGSIRIGDDMMVYAGQDADNTSIFPGNG